MIPWHSKSKSCINSIIVFFISPELLCRAGSVMGLVRWGLEGCKTDQGSMWLAAVGERLNGGKRTSSFFGGRQAGLLFSGTCCHRFLRKDLGWISGFWYLSILGKPVKLGLSFFNIHQVSWSNCELTSQILTVFLLLLYKKEFNYQLIITSHNTRHKCLLICYLKRLTVAIPPWYSFP